MIHQFCNTLDSSTTNRRPASSLAAACGLAALLWSIAPTAASAQASAASVSRGQGVFTKAGCATCHGAKGEGAMGPRIAPVPRALPEFTSFLRKPSASMSPVPPSQISDAQVADLYAYLSSLAPKGQVAAVMPPGDAENGKRLFKAAACYACHGYIGQGGGAGPRLGPPAISFQAFISELRHPREEMPPYTTKSLTDAQVNDIYAHVKTFPEPPDLATIPLLKKP